MTPPFSRPVSGRSRDPERSGMFIYLNAGKLASVTLDLDRPRKIASVCTSCWIVPTS